MAPAALNRADRDPQNPSNIGPGSANRGRPIIALTPVRTGVPVRGRRVDVNNKTYNYKIIIVTRKMHSCFTRTEQKIIVHCFSMKPAILIIITLLVF